MGYLKNLSSEVIAPPFPQATFEIADDVPQSQCSEAKIENTGVNTLNIPIFVLLNTGKFVGFNLVGKVCTITAAFPGPPGDYDITANDDNTLTLAQDPGDSSGVDYYVHDGGSLILTRNIQSFAEYIHASTYAYTIKGGKLYTDIPSNLLQPACSILFDPLT